MFENLPHSRQVYQSKQDHLERKRSSARRSVIQIERGEREQIIRIVSGVPWVDLTQHHTLGLGI